MDKGSDDHNREAFTSTPGKPSFDIRASVCRNNGINMQYQPSQKKKKTLRIKQVKNQTRKEQDVCFHMIPTWISDGGKAKWFLYRSGTSLMEKKIPSVIQSGTLLKCWQLYPEELGPEMCPNIVNNEWVGCCWFIKKFPSSACFIKASSGANLSAS